MASYTIMIADDDPAILDAVGTMLEFEGYSVVTVSTGSAVLEKMEENIDLLLLDIWMSGEDGRDICRLLKQNKATRAIPVIMISASIDLARSAREAGADDFLEKPFSMADLFAKIDRQLGKDSGN